MTTALKFVDEDDFAEVTNTAKKDVNSHQLTELNAFSSLFKQKLATKVLKNIERKYEQSGNLTTAEV